MNRLRSIILASGATIAIASSASSQTVNPTPQYGSTGNGCMGFGVNTVAIVNGVADQLNIPTSLVDNPIQAKRLVQQQAYGQWKKGWDNFWMGWIRENRGSAPSAGWDVPPGASKIGGPEGFERAFRNLRDEDYARCFPRVIKFMNDASARAEANRQRDIADQARKAEQARAAAQAKHEADLVDKAREANEARKAAEIAGQQARETHQRDLEIRAAQAEQAKALAEAAKKRAAEAAALDQQRQQADAERLQAEAQIAKIEADALARKRAEEEAARDRAEAARKQAGAEQRAQAEREAAKPQPQPQPQPPTAATPSPSAAQTQDDRYLMLALADFLSFSKYCPAHWERLSPDTMQMLVNMSKKIAAKLGREAMNKAAKEAIARNAGKPKSWCDETFTVIDRLAQ